jgi:hypothetical protein
MVVHGLLKRDTKQNPSNGCNIFSEVLKGEMVDDKIGIEILVKKLEFTFVSRFKRKTIIVVWPCRGGSG